MWKKDEKSETGLYIMGWCILAALVLLVIFLRVTGMRLSQLLGPCMIHTFTGYYCPGCGGTRAVHALFSGDCPLLPLSPGGFVHSGIWYLVYGEPDRAAAFTREISDRDAFPNGLSVGRAWLDCCKFLIKNLALLIFHSI